MKERSGSVECPCPNSTKTRQNENKTLVQARLSWEKDTLADFWMGFHLSPGWLSTDILGWLDSDSCLQHKKKFEDVMYIVVWLLAKQKCTLKRTYGYARKSCAQRGSVPFSCMKWRHGDGVWDELINIHRGQCSGRMENCPFPWFSLEFSEVWLRSGVWWE